MAASAWRKYQSFPERLGNKVFEMDTDTFKMALYLSTSNAATVSNAVRADLTNEHANANGYTTGGITLTPVWSFTTDTTTWDSSTDPVWTASGGSIVCRFAVIWDDTPTAPADPLICYSLLDTTPADITVTTGNTLTIQLNASGILTVTGMTA